MVGELPGQYQPDQENINPQFIIIPEQRLLRAVFGETKLPIQPIHPSRRQELIQTTQEVLGSLKGRERNVVQMRFGLEDNKKRSLGEIGREFGVTRERIRQIEAKVLRKLRHPSRSRHLYQYIVLPADSVASSIANLNDEGFLLVEKDLVPVNEVSLSELGLLAPLVEYVKWQTASSWVDVRQLFRADAKLFSDYLSDDQIVTLRESLRRVYEKAQAGFYQKPEEPELPSQPTMPEAGQRLIYPNRLFPNIQIPLEELAVIGPRSIKELGLSVRVYNTLGRQGWGRFERLPITTIAELLSQTRQELLRTRNFGMGSLEELEQRFRIYHTQRSWGEGEIAEEILRQATSQLSEIPAGKYPLADNERITGERSGAQFTLTKNIVILADGNKVSFLGLSLSGEVEDKEQLIQEFTQALGQPNSRIASIKPEGVDFLSWPL